MINILKEIEETFELSQEETDLINFDHINKVFAELEKIYAKNAKYDMRWAFNNAAEKIQSIYDVEITNLFNHHLEIECEESVQKEIMYAKKASRDKISQISNNFSQVILSTHITEIIVAFVLIMLITTVSGMFAQRYATLISTTVITMLFAFFKIFLERAFIQKLLYKRELLLYRKSIDITKRNFEDIIIFYFELSRVDHQNCSRPEKLRELNELISKYHRKLS